ncbi:MAG TPA: HAMP domain-containing sensor histidine kinase [Acidimicrobiales bacterium]|nr:HAMP domain-containing sensor histidine kinase [Acidimicrobiales bacterium]
MNRPVEWLRAQWRSHVGTVRFRLTALAAVVVLVVLALTGVGLVTAQRELLTDGVDTTLRQRADEIEALLRSDHPDDAFDRVWGGRGDEDNVVQMVDDDGKVLNQSANIATHGRPIAEDPVGYDDAFHTVDDLPVDDDDFRLLSRIVPVDGLDTDWVVVHVATDIDEVRESAEVLGALLLWVIPIVTILLAVVVWWLTGRTLRPVEAIRSEVALMGGSDLDTRVPVPPTDDEIARLARTMNAMLDRVEQAQRRQQRFVADASHELRTPLTRIRSDLEVDIAHPQRADRAATEQRVLDEALAMQGLIDDLLHLAKADAGANRAAFAPVDVDDLVLREARRLRDRGRVDVDVHAVSAGQTVGDAGQLARLVRNLADNAERHADGTVRFSLTEDDDQLVLVVADDGPGIPAEDRVRIFERFTRLDDARTRDAGGAGLGLAIVQEIVSRHHGTVAAVDPTTNGDGTADGARFEVHLPRTPGDGAG